MRVLENERNLVRFKRRAMGICGKTSFKTRKQLQTLLAESGVVSDILSANAFLKSQERLAQERIRGIIREFGEFFPNGTKPGPQTDDYLIENVLRAKDKLGCFYLPYSNNKRIEINPNFRDGNTPMYKIELVSS